MAFFREYLRQHGQEIDQRFDEADESLFVLALMDLRLGLPLRPFDPEEGQREKIPEELQRRKALHFVSAFLCFFVPKPPQYLQEIDVFKNYFIPGFSTDRAKQKQLFDSALPSFSQLNIEEAGWTSINLYFKPEYRKGVHFAGA